MHYSLGLLVTDSVIQMSYAESKLVTKKLSPHVKGEFVRECMETAAELLAQSKMVLECQFVSKNHPTLDY